ncbi:MAG: DUF4097 domain-containing protein [Lachnospiraceae bacterium]|nr:DUF4097 domain-containing protein [Lachnospiraceae bacterium]
MKLATKILVAAGVVLMVVGIIIMSGAMATTGFNFNVKELSNVEYETKDYKFSGDLAEIDIDSSIADIEFFVDESKDLSIEIKQCDDITFDVEFNNGKLTIKSRDKKKFNFFGGFYTDLHIYVYLPKAELDKVKIDGSVGAVKIPAITCNDMKIDESTGSTTLEGVTVKNELKIDSSTGSIKLINVTADSIKLDVSTGSIYFEDCEANEIDADASTGSIKGTLKGDYNYNADSSTGSVSVPESKGSRKCRLTTSTGSIKITKSL